MKRRSGGGRRAQVPVASEQRRGVNTDVQVNRPLSAPLVARETESVSLTPTHGTTLAVFVPSRALVAARGGSL